MAETFPNVLAVVEYLESRGWKVAQSAAYNHVKQGKLKKNAQGKFTKAAVDRYAGAWLKLKGGPEDSREDDQDALAREKLAAEARKAQAQAEHWEHKTAVERGQFVPQGEFERQLAARAVVFRSDLMNFCVGAASEICGLVEGDPERVPDLMEFLKGRMVLLLDRYAQDTEFDIPG